MIAVRLGLALTFCLPLAACPGGADPVDADDADRFAATLEDDLADLAGSVEDAATSAGALQDETRETAEDCYATFGDCTFCYTVSGGYLAGDFSAATSPAACGAEVTMGGVSATYTVQQSALEGTWAASNLAGDYAIEMTGSRSATLTTSTARRGETSFDSAWTLESLSATTESYTLSTLDLSLAYGGFADHAWTVTVSGTTAAVTGTVAVDDASVSCTISGSMEAPSVACQ